MARYKPSAPFTVPMILLLPVYSVQLGVAEKSFPKMETLTEKFKFEFAINEGEPIPFSEYTTIEEGIRINGSFRTYGGTERDVNGLFVVDDTAIIETWYRPDIKADCRIYIPDNRVTYEILGTPEDIELRHQYLKFKVQAITGGA